MTAIDDLLAANRDWAARTHASDPALFERLGSGQAPGFFWIGCADSRVPATQICGVDPGTIFVQRNVANLVDPEDANCMAALTFAVEVLRIDDLIVCGHRDCGGVRASLEGAATGVIAEWLKPLVELVARRRADLDALPEPERIQRLCEWNVAEQVRRLANTPPVRAAREAGRDLRLHGLVYSVGEGVLTKIDVDA